MLKDLNLLSVKQTKLFVNLMYSQITKIKLINNVKILRNYPFYCISNGYNCNEEITHSRFDKLPFVIARHFLSLYPQKLYQSNALIFNLLISNGNRHKIQMRGALKAAMPAVSWTFSKQILIPYVLTFDRFDPQVAFWFDYPLARSRTPG